MRGHEGFGQVVGAHARAMPVAAPVQPSLHVQVTPFQGAFEMGGAHGALGVVQPLAHHATDGAHAEVVHHVVDGAAAKAQLGFLEPGGDVLVHALHAPGVAVELGAVHHAVGIGGFAPAALVGDAQARVARGHEARLQHLAVALEVGIDFLPAAVFVVVGFVVRGVGAHEEHAAGDGGVAKEIKAAKAARRGGGIDFGARGFAGRLNRELL